MQFLVFVSCVFAVSSAGWIPLHYEQHVPIIGKHGVPLEPTEVQHARAEHLAAHAGESAKHAGSDYEEPQHNSYEDNGDYQHYQPEPVEHEYHHHAAPAISHVSYANHVSHEVPYHHEAKEYQHVSHQPHAYQTHHGVPTFSHDGKPLDTPEVEEAKAHHFAAVHEALASVSHDDSVSHYRYRRNILPYHQHSAPVIGHDGSPIETAEVQHAKALHFAAHEKASAGQFDEDNSGHYAKHYDHYEIPAIGHDGKPLDTAEVAHAKAAHLAAYQEIAEKNSIAPYHNGGEQSYDHNEGTSGHYAHHITHVYNPKAHYDHNEIPAIGHDGKPLDTKEVEEAKAHHFAAVHEALASASHHGLVSHYRKRRNVLSYHQHSAPMIGHNGSPIETAEVQHAKALHLAAHAKASAGQQNEGINGYYAHHITHVYNPKAHYDHDEIPAIGHDGKPLDTAEVAHAKVAHLAAYQEIAEKNSIASYHNSEEQSYDHNEGNSGHYAHHITHVYSPKAHYNHDEIPAIGHDGKPLDTAEVAHANAAHFVAYHKAAEKNSIAPYHYGGEQSYGHNGAPEDTHEVQIAKAKHLAAHAAAKASHY